MLSPKILLILLIISLSAVTLFREGCSVVNLRPKESRIENTPINTTLNPIQIDLPTENNEFFFKEVDGVKAMITPQADYKISGRVVSRRHYHRDWFAKLSPVDLAIAWGEFSTNQHDAFISYWHSDRYYSFKYTGDFRGDPSLIGTYSANEHLIPANARIAKAIKSIKVDEIVELSGQLVNVDWMDKKLGALNINTSLTRDDKGAGACEVIYVTKVKIQNKVYE